jgi:hypothetical protein
MTAVASSLCWTCYHFSAVASGCSGHASRSRYVRCGVVSLRGALLPIVRGRAVGSVGQRGSVGMIVLSCCSTPRTPLCPHSMVLSQAASQSTCLNETQTDEDEGEQ